jgi:hypothetical protein
MFLNRLLNSPRRNLVHQTSLYLQLFLLLRQINRDKLLLVLLVELLIKWLLLSDLLDQSVGYLVLLLPKEFLFTQSLQPVIMLLFLHLLFPLYAFDLLRFLIFVFLRQSYQLLLDCQFVLPLTFLLLLLQPFDDLFVLINHVVFLVSGQMVERTVFDS